MLKIVTKTFQDLNTEDLYAILELRSEVFVVEQDCVYQDIDYKDQKAIHVIGYKNNKVVAYSRLFKPKDYFELASIGRVVVAKNERQHKYGYQIMEASITAIQSIFNESEIKISAQCYLEKFYTNLGFKPTGESYLEDGIPHMAMIKS
ncbi:GNAT family N-acetyltransferase [Aurantibacter aestuarii]|uniref:GNAT family N-acetyltransferase n=1 Tax=Aurantibacter aestuarii TaxID=1266046 RepID=A0A2T1ND24_9FLAO|nr:GNAT family N-acetyltransferase [Aurantibacter aestuarii]PSG90317.1 GNAT family N-acetyltransferase [Aurantibacter aestuarii]